MGSIVVVVKREMGGQPKRRTKRNRPVPQCRNVFISFHEQDGQWRNQFVSKLNGRMIDCSVKIDYVNKVNRKVDDIRRVIRDEYLKDTTVTVVLIGVETWQRKHIDWEIGATLRDTDANELGGLVGIVLPTHPDYGKPTKHPRRIPPRLVDNLLGKDPYASLYDWPKPFEEHAVVEWIERAHSRRDRVEPINTLEYFAKNRRTDPLKGWN